MSEHVLPRNSRELIMSRRTFMTVGIRTIGLVIGLGVVTETAKQTERVLAKAAQERRMSLALLRELDAGLSGSWRDMVIFPSLSLVPPGSKLYRSPTLNKDSLLTTTPPKEQDALLLVQYPIIAEPTARRNLDEPTPIKPGVVGFWMPDSNQLVYSRWSNQEPSTTKLIELDSTQQAGLTWRYSVTSEHGSHQGRPDMVVSTEVVGRSVWVDPQEATYIFNSGNDPIGLPLPLM